MSAETSSIIFPQRPRQPNESTQGVVTLERPGFATESRVHSLSGIRPAQGSRAAAPATRPAPPWDLTTRVPAAGARHTNPEDLTLFAMQLLSAEDALPVAKHVEHCVECRRELAHIRGDLGAYAFSVEMREPSTAPRERLTRYLAREKKAVPVSQSRSAATIATFGRTTSILVSDVDEVAKPSRTPVVLAWAGWTAAVALGLTAGVIYHNSQGIRTTVSNQTAQITRIQAEAAESRRVMDAVTDPQAQRVTLTPKPLPPSPVGRTTYNPDRGALVFLASDMDPIQPDKTYELWLIPADGSNPVPAGTFHPDDQGNASVLMPSLPKGVQAKGFNVTIEDEGGSQTPTKPIVMSGF